MTAWVYRVYLFVRADTLANAKTKARSIMAYLEGEAAQDATFDAVRLSVSGSTPVQAYGCSTALTAAMATRLKAELEDVVLDPAKFRAYVCDYDTLALRRTNSPNVVANRQVFTWDDALADMGLQVIRTAL